MRFQLLVDFDSFWENLSRDIQQAEAYTYVQTFSFEGDRAGKMLADSLSAAQAPDKRILVDSFSRVVISDRFLYAPRNWRDRELQLEVRETRRLHRTLAAAGVQIKYGNAVGLSPRRLLKRNHKKLILIDGRVAYIGGINFSEHNAAWHDMMLRIEDCDAAEFFRKDFLGGWQGHSAKGTESLAGIELHTLNGRANASTFVKVLELIEGAQSSIFIESPYVTFPFYDRLRDARSRGVQVTIVTPKKNNWNHFADYAKWEAARCDIDLRLFKNGMSHLKAMLIDDRYLIAGSSNFDFLSYHVYEEILAIITEPQLIADFRRRVLEVDLANSERVEEELTAYSSGWSRLRLRLFNKGLATLLE
ncbi:MAG TPA: phosphatidylserine/phosphatidylglycerophosphate/cardiolipin synthase family protein [Pyrinomonadaceae bacterium]|nr:phosphatidylserine/phosphatidylglycerophosphate/cardiolipin synthase family protein [Pyrinomonadaceae bacterium]